MLQGDASVKEAMHVPKEFHRKIIGAKGAKLKEYVLCLCPLLLVARFLTLPDVRHQDSREDWCRYNSPETRGAVFEHYAARTRGAGRGRKRDDREARLERHRRGRLLVGAPSSREIAPGSRC